MKWLIAILVLGAASWAAWAFLIKSPPRRACERLAELCGERSGDSKSCDSYFVELDKTGPGESDKVAKCIHEAHSCSEAVGCTAGGSLLIGADAARDFLQGLGKSLAK